MGNDIFSRNVSTANGLTRESEWLPSTLDKAGGAPAFKPADGKKTNLDNACVVRDFVNDSLLKHFHRSRSWGYCSFDKDREPHRPTPLRLGG